MKEELRLAFKQGALSVLNSHDLSELMANREQELEKMFESWFQGIAPLLALTTGKDPTS